MYNFTDRQPKKVGRRKITPENGTPYYATVELADEAEVQGTAITRAAMMAIQGMEDSTTQFLENGNIIETYNNGTTKTTVFNSDGSITEKVVHTATGQTYTQTTVFNSDGSINVMGGEAITN